MLDFSSSFGAIITVIAILLPIGILAVIGHFKNKEREMIHRERMLAMEKGLQPPIDAREMTHREILTALQRDPRSGGRNYLLHGLIWLFVGLGALASMYLFRGSWEERVPHGPLSLVPLPFLAFIPAGVGVAFLIYYAIEAGNPRPPAP
ncbi:MAG: DUF6249 domain-containing protein [Bryobacteraceae bacterium]